MPRTWRRPDPGDKGPGLYLAHQPPPILPYFRRSKGRMNTAIHAPEIVNAARRETPVTDINQSLPASTQAAIQLGFAQAIASFHPDDQAVIFARLRTTQWFEITNSASVDTAEIRLYGDVGTGGVTAAQFVQELEAINAPTITLYINSPGGQVFDGLAIHNALRSHRAKVTVVIDSLAASIASIIAMAGDRIIMRPHSQLMIHDARCWLGESSPAEMREYAELLDRQSDNLADVYVRRAGGTRAQWRATMAQDTWYSADEAVAAGLADEVSS